MDLGSRGAVLPAGDSLTRKLVIRPGRFDVPRNAVIQREVRRSLPAVLRKCIVLMRYGVDQAARRLRVIRRNAEEKINSRIARAVSAAAVKTIIAVVVRVVGVIYSKLLERGSELETVIADNLRKNIRTQQVRIFPRLRPFRAEAQVEVSGQPDVRQAGCGRLRVDVESGTARLCNRLRIHSSVVEAKIAGPQLVQRRRVERMRIVRVENLDMRRIDLREPRQRRTAER